MGLMVYLLIFNLFLLRIITLENPLGESSPTKMSGELMSEKSYLVLLKIYIIANMAEYGITLLFLSGSLLFYDSLHTGFTGRNKILKHYFIGSWVLNIII